MTVLPDARIGPALTGVGSRLGGIAACTLGLTLALCLAGAAGLLTFDAVAAAVGFVVGAGLIVSRAVVGHALERTREPRAWDGKSRSTGCGAPASPP